ncbi:MAG TPA: glycosyltransferase family 2 protein [Patescibacteria group bacterium]|nr:glycosyltransferase family 2 protein [Patescibacteria group bacterium]
MAKKKIISVIILSWNTKKILENCLQSLFNFQPDPYELEVIVVDNASTDGSPAMIKKKFRQVKLIENKENLGFTKGNNQGMKKARGDYLLILNSDTLIKDKAPVKMARFLENNDQVGVVGCKLLNSDGTNQPSYGPFPHLRIAMVMLFAEHWLGGHLVRRSGEKTVEADWVMASALMIRKEVIKRVGMFDEKIFMYMEETEWCYRIKKAGYQVIFYPEARITHLERASSVTGRKDPILNIYRGLIYFYKKHYPAWQLPVLRLMLKLKAGGALLLGYLIKKQYLKETYGEAFKIA